MLAQVLGAERERFLLGEKNTYIIEGNWPAGAKMEVRLDGHEISAKLVSGEKEEELSRSEEAVRLLGEKKKITVELPEGWGIEQEITCVDATTYQVYMANMKSLFMDMIRNTDMVVFNRCKEGDPLPAYRRGIKVANQSAEVIFENEEGEMDDIFQDEMPFDINAPIIEIPPEDYGIWFVDAMDNPDKYVDKIVRFKGRVMKPRGMGSKFFVPGRVAMTCCADDTTFLGYVCRSDYAPHIKEGSWVEVTAKVAFENRTEYQGEGIVLYASDVKECEPLKEEMVYFN